MKQSIKSLLKLSGKPINAVKEKTHLTHDELVVRNEILRVIRNSHHLTLLPSGVRVPREGFIRAMNKLQRWVIVSSVAVARTGDYDTDNRPNYYSGMRKGVPVFNNNRIRVYKTRAGAERAIKRIVQTGLLLENQLSIVGGRLLTGD